MSNIIKIVFNEKKDSKKIRAIEFMETLIQDLKKDRLDPEKILIFVKWVDEINADGTPKSESYEFYDNIKYTENLLGCVALLKERILNQTIQR
tara:strand:+ start:57 stop:335 length:279 start_codon:yes stop_codon:yes gene_type:complete